MEAAAARARRLWEALGRALAQQDARWLIGIFLLALVLRLTWIAVINPDPADGRFDDSVWYDSTAQNLADGKGYSYSPDIWRQSSGEPLYPRDAGISKPTAIWPIGYPLTLAGIYTFGRSLIAAKLFNAILGSVTCLLLYGIGARVFNRRVGLVAALLLALFPSHIIFSTLLMTEVYFTFLFMLVLYLTLRWTWAGGGLRPYQALVLGLLIAWGAMVRGELALFFLVPVLVWLVTYRSWRRAVAYGALAVGGMALIYVPWTVRNAVQLDAFVVGTTGVGGVMLQGHNDQADGSPDLYAGLRLQREYEDVPNPEREVRINNTATRESIEYAVTHPLRELELIPRRFYYLYRSDETAVTWLQSNRPSLDEVDEERFITLTNAYYFAILGWALLGLPLWFSLRDGRRLLLLLSVLYYTALYCLLFVGHERYHFPIMPVVSLMAAVTWVALLGWVRSPRERAERPSPGEGASDD